MPKQPVAILISANSEWRVVRETYNPLLIEQTPFGGCFELDHNGQRLVFVHGGWGKISAAASTQYAIDRWNPQVIINLGTCGGLDGYVSRGELLLVEQTIVYDIVEQMGDPDDAILAYTIEIDLSWLRPPYPLEVRKAKLLSADRDILVDDVPHLIARYQAIAADWESGAIAWTAAKNQVRTLIIRGVTDLVNIDGGEAYGNQSLYTKATGKVMTRLLDSLPGWLSCIWDAK